MKILLLKDIRLREQRETSENQKCSRTTTDLLLLQEIRLGSRHGYLLESLSVVLIPIPTLCVGLIRKKRMRASTVLTTRYWRKWSISRQKGLTPRFHFLSTRSSGASGQHKKLPGLSNDANDTVWFLNRLRGEPFVNKPMARFGCEGCIPTTLCVIRLEALTGSSHCTSVIHERRMDINRHNIRNELVNQTNSSSTLMYYQGTGIHPVLFLRALAQQF